MRHVRTWALLAFSVLCACGGDDLAPAKQFEISGRVIDARTGKAISKAEVEFNSDTLDHAATSSDDDGHFSFDVSVREGVAFGTITAEHANYRAPTAETVY